MRFAILSDDRVIVAEPVMNPLTSADPAVVGVRLLVHVNLSSSELIDELELNRNEANDLATMISTCLLGSKP